MIAGLKPYAEYKESGSRWLGAVPVTWEVRNLRTLISKRTERDRADLPLLSVAREKGVFVRSLTDVDENHNVIPEDLSNYKVARAGSLVINKMKAWQGSMGIAPCDGIVSPAYFVFDFRIANHAFGQRLLRSKPYVAHFGQASDGVRVGQWDLSIPGMRQIPVLVPPPHEQAAIVRFLNWANGRLERAIRAKRQVIALLNEQKQAIIHRAVTRGLDPSVPLKPSGIPWLGDIPQHWEVRRLKNVLARNDGGVWGTEFDDNGTIVLRSTEQAVDGEWRIRNPARIRLADAAQSATLLLEGDLLITKSSGSSDHIGKTSLVSEEVAAMQCCYSNFMQRLRVSGRANSKFIAQLLNSRTGRQHYRVSSTSTTGLGNLTSTIIGCVPIALPPRLEQDRMVEYLAETLAVPNEAISRLNREIELLREYRTRLVADVVTGKLDVRDAAAQLPDDAPLETIEDDADLNTDPDTADEEAAV